MTDSEKIAIIYHRIFSFELSPSELTKWRAGSALTLASKVLVKAPLKKKEKNLHDLLITKKKMEIAKSGGQLLSKIPTVLFVGVTGSLAMKSAKEESDIDLMIITKKGTLWTTRILAILCLRAFGFKTRVPGNSEERDRLCTNLWIDESALTIPNFKKSAYTAHEVLQVVPLVNKNNTYEHWLISNAWVWDYWPYVRKMPNSVHEKSISFKEQNSLWGMCLLVVEVFLKWIQYKYMKRKKTREIVNSSEAYFHPFDWNDYVKNALKKEGVLEQKALR